MSPIWPKAMHGDLGSRQLREGKMTLRRVLFSNIFLINLINYQICFPLPAFRNKNETFLFMCQARGACQLFASALGKINTGLLL